jgi:hypothetical protein
MSRKPILHPVYIINIRLILQGKITQVQLLSGKIQFFYTLINCWKADSNKLKKKVILVDLFSFYCQPINARMFKLKSSRQESSRRDLTVDYCINFT